ncbi:hypothetical protein [Lyngbya sp. PCC 8106]|uniref:hypothetical protein n=1 Tax=Lyngbya sp. (strain PCC 8106) TaxID=313612 RepID=UPI0000EAA587|nr:hypothetical protein [Lyngbya sp. PCC 8106]EAW35315.1 hypothetical protein L8106_20565 [Lyngbya sp. PCC 8106]
MNLVDLIAVGLETIVIGILTLHCIQRHSLFPSAFILLGFLFLIYSSSLTALAVPYLNITTSHDHSENVIKPPFVNHITPKYTGIQTSRKFKINWVEPSTQPN